MAKTQKVKISLQASLKEYEFEVEDKKKFTSEIEACLLYTSPSPRDLSTSRMPSSA